MQRIKIECLYYSCTLVLIWTELSWLQSELDAKLAF